MRGARKVEKERNLPGQHTVPAVLEGSRAPADSPLLPAQAALPDPKRLCIPEEGPWGSQTRPVCRQAAGSGGHRCCSFRAGTESPLEPGDRGGLAGQQ